MNVQDLHFSKVILALWWMWLIFLSFNFSWEVILHFYKCQFKNAISLLLATICTVKFRRHKYMHVLIATKILCRF